MATLCISLSKQSFLSRKNSLCGFSKAPAILKSCLHLTNGSFYRKQMRHRCNREKDSQAVAGSVVGHDAGTHPPRSSRERRSLWTLRVRCLTLGCPGVGDTSSPKTDLELQTKWCGSLGLGKNSSTHTVSNFLPHSPPHPSPNSACVSPSIRDSLYC